MSAFFLQAIVFGLMLVPSFAVVLTYKTWKLSKSLLLVKEHGAKLLNFNTASNAELDNFC